MGLESAGAGAETALEAAVEEVEAAYLRWTGEGRQSETAEHSGVLLHWL